MSPKWIAIIGCTVIGLLLLGFVAFLIAAPIVNERAMRSKSRDNMRSVLTLRLTKRIDVPLHGRNWILALVATGQVRASHRMNLEFLFPLTVTGLDGVDLAEYQALTLDLLKTKRFPHLTGYAGPGPLEPGWDGPRPLIGDLTSDDGASIGFSDGTVRWLDREELGLGDDDPIRCGPASRAPLLRMLSDD